MLVNISTEKLMEFSNYPKLLKNHTDTLFEIRHLLKSILYNKGITTYDSFFRLIKTVAPLEDEVELYRFWHGYFFSEYFVEFVSSLVKKFPYIDLTPFQDKMECKCKTCGSVILIDKKAIKK